MIDGLKKLKTLVIEEENNKLDFMLPKLDKKNSNELKRKIAKSNEAKNEYNHKINSNLKEMNEISKILETENENETPKANTKSKKIRNNFTSIIVDKQLNLNSSNDEKSSKNSEIKLKIEPQTNLFKSAIKR